MQVVGWGQVAMWQVAARKQEAAARLCTWLSAAASASHSSATCLPRAPLLLAWLEGQGLRLTSLPPCLPPFPSLQVWLMLCAPPWAPRAWTR